MKGSGWSSQVLGVILIALLVTGCGGVQATPAPSVVVEATATAVPPTVTPVLPTPTPMPPTVPPPTVPPTAEPPATGVVRGVLTEKSSAQPLSGVRMALGTVEYDTNGQPAGYKVSAEAGEPLLSAYTDAGGAFAVEAPAGVYVLVSPGGSTTDQIARDAGGTALIVEVEAGQAVDLGTIGMVGPVGTPSPGGGTITGLFTDKAGAPLSGWLWLAAVTGKKDTGEDSYEGVTPYVELSETGAFTFGDVPPGDYLIIGFVIIREDLYATVTISNQETKLIFPFNPARGPMVALVDEYEPSAAADQYQDYIQVGATGGLLSGSHEFMTITPGVAIDLVQLQIGRPVWYNAGMARAPIYVRQLTDDERAALIAGLRSRDAFVLRRCQILLASASGKRASQIGAELGCDTDTALNAINAFNRAGLECLTPGSTVAHTIERGFDAVQAEALRALLHQSPRGFGKETSLWTLELAAQVSFEQGLTRQRVSREAVRTALQRLGVRWKRAKQWITSPDPEYVRKKGTATD